MHLPSAMTSQTISSTSGPVLSPQSVFEHLAAEGVFDRDAWRLPARRAALDRFSRRGYPHTREENWRFTHLGPLTALPFRPVVQRSQHDLRASDLDRLWVSGWEGHRLVFVDGFFAPELSRVRAEAGVLIGPILGDEDKGDALQSQRLGRLAEREEDANPFVALNSAYFQDGAVIRIEPGVRAAPIELLFVSLGREEGAAVHVRNLVELGRSSGCEIMERYIGLGRQSAVTNTVAEVTIGEHAELEHTKLQDDSVRSFHLAAALVEVGRSGSHRYHSFATGARLSRTHIHTALAGEGIVANLDGLYIAGGDQLADHFMVVEHAQPRGESLERFHGILDGAARGVFHGRIRVHPGAQKTNAKQTNRNILLSATATVDTKPQLEIYADDVRCTHGATVGQLNEEAVFYLRSRGLGEARARRMLVEAFAGEIVDLIRSEPARDCVRCLVRERLDRIAALSAHD